MKNMKHFVLGIALFVSGVIGFVGWSIACVCSESSGVYDSVFSYADCGADIIVLSVYAAMSGIGLLIALLSMREKAERDAGSDKKPEKKNK